jgi:hypothetical protein
LEAQADFHAELGINMEEYYMGYNMARMEQVWENMGKYGRNVEKCEK